MSHVTVVKPFDDQKDLASQQLNNYKQNKGGTPEILTTAGGSTIGDKLNVLTVGPRGPQLLQDSVYLEEIAHFDRERIPERVVHAKAAGAFGYFEVTDDITRYCRANLFSEIGKKTPIAGRFSQVVGESGSSDTVRDPRGLALKFYTEEGNWDLVGNNTPIFFIRDPLLFPSLIHSQKRNPVTHLKDPDAFWDFISLRPETSHLTSMLFSDRGIPDGHRHMDGFGINTFKLVNDQDQTVYCKFHYKTDQGIRNLRVERAKELASSDPDYSIRDLYNAIESGNYPSWTFYIQIMTFQQAENWYFNPFDVTKVWPHKEFPLIRVGKLVFNRNPKNYFAEVEQLAFCPSRFVNGIEASPDKVLQGRLFSYPDTNRYRLGANFLQIPVNCPYRARTRNYERDGHATVNDNQDGAPNYYPNSFSGPIEHPLVREPAIKTSGDIDRYNSGDEDNYTQPGMFYRNVLDSEEKKRTVKNIADYLIRAQRFIQDRVVSNFKQVDVEFGTLIEKELNSFHLEDPAFA